jgi:hypothetical protein
MASAFCGVRLTSDIEVDRSSKILPVACAVRGCAKPIDQNSIHSLYMTPKHSSRRFIAQAAVKQAMARRYVLTIW